MQELQEKISDLESFLASDTFERLSRIDKDLLITQFTTMASYFQILHLRYHIANAQVTPQNSENIN